MNEKQVNIMSEKQVQNLHRRVAELEVELKKCQEGEQIVGIANLETGIGIDFIKQNEALKAQNEKLVAELNEITTDFNKLRELHESLSAKFQTCDQAKRLLEASVAQLKQDKIAMQQELEVALAQNAEVKMKYNHLRTELEKLITQ